jgi:hypothetical protein
MGSNRLGQIQLAFVCGIVTLDVPVDSSECLFRLLVLSMQSVPPWMSRCALVLNRSGHETILRHLHGLSGMTARKHMSTPTNANCEYRPRL